MRFRRSHFLALTFAAGLLVGCGGTERTLDTRTDAPPATVELNEVSYAGLDAAVQEQKGKVVMLDVWFLG